MPRTKGATNKDSQQRKLEMLNRIWARMRASKGKPISWREMAAAAEVGLATLTHHFGKRDDVIAAVLKAKKEEGKEALRILAEPQGDLATSIAQALDHLSLGIEEYDVGDLLSFGFAEGIDHEKLGPAFVEDGLEPIIQGMTARLQVHQERGEIREDVDVRIGAIALVSPLIVTYLHQSSLGGSTTHPVDLIALKQQTCKSFIESYAL